jgi:GlcNAc-P-P-Und epimerase
MKVLVTGGSGFIGSNLVTALLDAGHDVLSLDICPPRNVANKAVTKIIDPLDSKELEATFEQFDPEFIYHLGARTDLDGKSLTDYDYNVRGVNIVIDAANKCSNLLGIFFASSRLVCKIGYTPKSEDDYCPTTAYGESKVKGEEIVRLAEIKVPWCIFRPTSIWGPWFDVPYKTFFLTVAHGRYVHPRGEKIYKSFSFVGNSVYYLMGLMKLSSNIYNRKTFYLCDDPPLEVGVWADEIASALGRSRPKRVPLFVLKIAALAGDFLKLIGMKNPPLTCFRLANLTCQMIHDGEFLKTSMGPAPYSTKEGVAETVKWLRLHDLS